jgi:hypothetical protein
MQAQVKGVRVPTSRRRLSSHLRILTFAQFNVHPILLLLPQSPLPQLLLIVRPHDNRFITIRYMLTFDIFIYTV